MKKLLLLLVGCLITNNAAIALACGCDYCSKPQQEVKSNLTK